MFHWSLAPSKMQKHNVIDLSASTVVAKDYETTGQKHCYWEYGRCRNDPVWTKSRWLYIVLAHNSKFERDVTAGVFSRNELSFKGQTVIYVDSGWIIRDRVTVNEHGTAFRVNSSLGKSTNFSLQRNCRNAHQSKGDVHAMIQIVRKLLRKDESILDVVRWWKGRVNGSFVVM